ncbi:hypothetical protein F5884DRAFT_312235 [Xylogone sp. PMI_703]|nr:hypothetical protein F5884DRAFT_312235 [Xylogone sp. PMI_703]
MTSYHRVLHVFERSVDDKSIECDYDIHPWEILINGERWSGKVRLIGFVDVFFLISYSANARFEHGIIIYKEDDAIRSILEKTRIQAEKIGLKIINEAEIKNKKPEKYFSFESGSIDYKIVSLGHEIGMKTEYPKTSLKRYEIKLQKPSDKIAKKRIRRGVNQHTMTQLIEDAMRLGIINHAEFVQQFLGQYVEGTAMDDTFKRYMATVARNDSSLSLSNEKV